MKQPQDILVDASRILAMEGHCDYTFGHVSERSMVSPGRFRIKPNTIGFEDVQSEDILEADLDGRLAGKAGKLPAEVFLHAAIYRKRPDVQAVVHTHAPNAILFSLTGRRLYPVGRQGMMFAGGVSVYPESGLVDNVTAAGKLCDALGNDRVLIIRNHGIVATGPSVEAAVFLAVNLEKICALNLAAFSCCQELDGIGKDLEDGEAMDSALANAATAFLYLRRKSAGFRDTI